MTMNNETDKSYNATGTSSGIQTSSKPAISWKRELCILLIGMVCGASLFAIYVNFKMKENQSHLKTTTRRQMRQCP